MRKSVSVFTVSGVLVALTVILAAGPPAEAGWCNGRSPASLAAVEINWKTLDVLAKAAGVVTGASEEDEAAEASPYAQLKKPVVVFVADPSVNISEFDKLQDVVFKNEKIGLAMKAFDAVRMSPSSVEDDPILEGKGKTVPRILVVDPTKEKVRVLETKKIKVSGLFSEMKRVANGFYKEKLDKVVKSHLKLLTSRDQLANEEKVLRGKENRLGDEDGKKAKKELEKITKELDEVRKGLEELATQERELWTLTPRNATA